MMTPRGNGRRYLAAALLLVVAAMASRTAWLVACGPFLFEVQAIASMQPAHLESYRKGDLGVIRPFFPRRYLVQAYRVLTARPPITNLVPPAALETPGAQQAPKGAQAWYQMRNRVVSLGEINARRRPYFNNPIRFLEPTLQFFVNCNDDAFEVAARTLAARIERFGLGSSEVRQWTLAQVDVFANCSEETLVIPEAPSERDPLMLADHQYQTGAAYFYGMKYEEAAARFREIGRNKASPWHPYGNYLAARSTLRQALVPDHDRARRDELLAQAAAELNAVLRDPAAAPLHASARGLLDFIDARLHQFEHLAALSAIVADAPAVTDQQLVDYRRMMDVLVGDVTIINYDRIAAAGRIAGTHELNDWILATQGTGDTGLARALRRWDETQAPLWLVSVLWKIPADHDATGRVLGAAAAVEQDSPAFATIAFLRARLLLDMGRRDEARALLATLPRQPQRGFDVDAVNLLTAARFKAAESLEELLASAPRTPIDAENTRPVFDEDAGVILTKRLPLELLVQAAQSPTLPTRLRVRVAAAAFARAVFLGRDDAGRRAARALRELAPPLRADLDAYLAASSPEAAQRAAVLLLLRTPGIHAYVQGPDDNISYELVDPVRKFDHMFRRNWWCEYHVSPIDENGSSPGGTSTLGLVYPDGRWLYPVFVTDAERKATAEELTALAAIGSPQGYLAEEAVEWARAQPDDLRAAEALALAVEGGRWSCGVNDSSRRAFQTLHRLFPRSRWAKQTPYWYRSHP